MTTIEVRELLYEVTLNITSMTEYGVSFAALMAREVAIPVDGARFDVAFEGRAAGPKLNGYTFMKRSGRRIGTTSPFKAKGSPFLGRKAASLISA